MHLHMRMLLRIVKRLEKVQTLIRLHIFSVLVFSLVNHFIAKLNEHPCENLSTITRSLNIRGLSKKFVEFVNKNKTTIPITFKFVYNEDTFTTDIITKF